MKSTEEWGWGGGRRARVVGSSRRELAVFLSVQITAGDRASEVWRQKPDSREAVSVDLTGKCLGERVLRFLVMLGSMRSHIDHKEPGEGVCPRESEARKTDSV